jgi:pimeloyl-ACP methyl ester carboxylesterase
MNMVVTAPRLRRAYFECRYGQLHVHNAIPAGGGFDEQTTLVCLHAAHNTGRVFLEVSKILGQARSVYSPDLPGCGESDGPPKQPSIGGYAEAICDFLDSMRFRQVDLLGVQSGSAIAAELAVAKPRVVRRVAMVGVPALDETERKSYRDLSAPEGLSQGALWARAAIINWKAQERLPLVKQPLLVLRPKDPFWEAGGRVARLVPEARVLDLPDQGPRMLETQAELVAKHLGGFLGS